MTSKLLEFGGSTPLWIASEHRRCRDHLVAIFFSFGRHVSGDSQPVVQSVPRQSGVEPPHSMVL